MSVKLSIFEALVPEAGVGFSYDEDGDFTFPTAAIMRHGDQLEGATWPDALYELEEYVSSLRRIQPAYLHTLTQAYDEDIQCYIPAESRTDWYQIVTQKSRSDIGVRTHLIRMHESED
jgi:hypothetical protein